MTELRSLFVSIKSRTVVPKRSAISVSVSPLRTLYRSDVAAGLAAVWAFFAAGLGAAGFGGAVDVT